MATFWAEAHAHVATPRAFRRLSKPQCGVREQLLGSSEAPAHLLHGAPFFHELKVF